MKIRNKIMLPMIGIMLAVTPVMADIAVISDEGQIINNTYSFSLGYTFSVTEDLLVTALGQFDVNGLAKTGEVALFNWDTGEKLSYTTFSNPFIQQTETGFYDTYFAPIPQFTLTSGVNYLLACEVVSGDVVWDEYDASIMTFDSRINWGEGRSTWIDIDMPDTATTSTFSVSQNLQSFFGPNMLVEAVPEPAIMGLIVFFGTSTLAVRRIFLS